MSLSPLLLSLDEPVFEATIDGLLLAATPALHELQGLHPSERLPVVDAFTEDDRARIAQALKRVASGKTATTLVEARIPSEDGMGVPVEIKLVAVRIEGGKPTGIGGWVRDISAEKDSERLATVQGTHLFNLVEHVDDACLVESVEGLVDTLNLAFCRLFGIDVAPQSLIGIDAADVFDQAREASGSKEGPTLAQGDSSSSTEYVVRGKIVKQRVFPIIDDGMPLGRLYLFKTATENAPVVADKSQTTGSQLEHIERIAREIAITVESAGSAIHRAEQLHLPAAIIGHFQQVETSARTAFTAIGGLLDFSKFEPGELKSLKLDKREFNLRETLAGLIEHVAGLTDDKQMQLRLRVEQDVPSWLKGDAPRLMLVLRNLLESVVPAIDVSSGGPVEILLAISPEYSSEGTIHLSFSLEASSVGKAARLKSYAPVALMQIAVARQLVKAMGGDIENLHRKDANGMAFAVAFPWQEKKEPKERQKFVTLTGLSALIVSADAAQRHELATLMRGWRMLPHEADNATMAIQLLLRQEAEGNPIPLIIVSNELPIQDGFLLAFRIKNHAKLKKTLVMMLAKSGKSGDAIACRENGIIAYLRHPVSATQLNEAIMAVTGVSAGDDSDATHTLITRHSLRESRRATILLIDADRETHLAAGNILRKRGYMLSEAEDAVEAVDAFDQEVYDLILVETKTPGLEDAVKSLRSIIQKNADTVAIIAISEDASEKHRKKCEGAGFDGFIAKPLEKDALLSLIAVKLPVREAAE